MSAVQKLRRCGVSLGVLAAGSPGVVCIGQQVDVARLFASREYWNPPPGERGHGLADKILPRARRYVDAHRDHGLIYLEDDMVFDPDGPCHGWVEIGEA